MRGDLKDKETMKCEHGRDVFEVTPTPPSSHHHHYHLHSTTPQLPLPPTSLYPIWPAPPRSFGRGVVESSVAFLANDAPLPTHAHTHIHTSSCEHIHSPLQRPTAAPIAGPLWLPLTGEKAQPTPSSSHMLHAAGSPAGKPRPPTFCVPGTPLNPPSQKTHTYVDGTSALTFWLKDESGLFE